MRLQRKNEVMAACVHPSPTNGLNEATSPYFLGATKGSRERPLLFVPSRTAGGSIQFPTIFLCVVRPGVIPKSSSRQTSRLQDGDHCSYIENRETEVCYYNRWTIALAANMFLHYYDLRREAPNGSRGTKVLVRPAGRGGEAAAMGLVVGRGAHGRR